jgi:endo-1,4-beta-mannosidase
MDFIKNIDGHFSYNGKRFRFVGCNMYELAFMEKKTTDLMLEDAKNEGFKVVRFWAFAPIKPEKLIEICDKANVLELRLIPVLADKWGYMQDYVVNDEWFINGYKESYLNYATGMVEVLKNKPEIMIWELINEPESDSFEAFYNFAKDTASQLKNAAPNHLLSIGTIGGLGSKFGGEFSRFTTKNFRKMYEIKELDAVSVHDYSYDATVLERLDTLYRFKGKYYMSRFYQRSNYYMTYLPLLFKRLWLKKFNNFLSVPFTLKWLWKKFIDRNIGIAKDLKKPFYLGEIGYKNDLKLDRKKIIDAEIQRYFDKGIDGYLLWSFEAQGWSKDGHNYGFTHKDGFKEIIQKHNKQLESA